MGLMKEHVRCNVVSLRVTEEERLFLEKEARLNRKSLSELVREALNQVMGYRISSPQAAGDWNGERGRAEEGVPAQSRGRVSSNIIRRKALRT